MKSTREGSETERPATSRGRLLTHAAALAVAAVVAGPAAAEGAGDLMVAPTRVVLEGRTRSAELTLVNRGSRPAMYRVSFVSLRMTESGALERVPTPGPDDAAALVRFSPRQVLLEPGVAQTVRLQVRKPANLPDGEYRAHLLFHAVPAGEEEESSAVTEGGFQVSLRPIFGISIPVIVRHGLTHASAEIEGASLRTEGERTLLDLVLRRKGNASLYGDVQATWIPTSGPPRSLGSINGVGVYVPLERRRIDLPLPGIKRGDLHGGTLRVAWVEKDGKGVLADATADVR